MILDKLEPKSVFHFFEEICNIPHGSFNEKALSDYLVKFAKDRNLEVIQDESFSIIIKKPASSDATSTAPIILQGHIDMVCEKNRDILHDFKHDPIKLLINEDFITADGTTLGADNGIAAAMELAILDSKDIPHPPIEAIFTTMEEVGLIGATNLDCSSLTGKILLNLDSEDEGCFCTSCAGGLQANVSLKIEYAKIPNGYKAYTLNVGGLLGGHSGIQIDQERGNANRILGRTMDAINNTLDAYFSNVNGGAKDNAIPREASATIYVNKDAASKFEELIKTLESTIKKELRVSDPGLKIVAVPLEENAEKDNNVFSKKTSEKLIAALLLIPNGIQSMSLDIDGLVETSNNIGVITSNAETVVLQCALRSSVVSRKYFLVEQIKIVAKILGMDVKTVGDYPAWEYAPESKIRDICHSIYKDLYKKEPVIQAIHAGLECGLLGEKIDSVDMISFGPDIIEPHTPDERVAISSTERTWEFLLAILKKLSA